MPSLALFGSTGAVGKHILAAALELKEYTSIAEIGRRSNGSTHDKLTSHKVDFEKADDHPKTGADVIISAFGTTRRAAGGAEQFRKIDHDYAVNSIKAQIDSSKKQRVIYCSSRGSNPNSSFLYLQSKCVDLPGFSDTNRGRTEQDIANLGAETIIFYPGFLLERGDGRLVEQIFGPITHYTYGMLSDQADVPTRVVGTAMAKAGVIGVEGLKKAGFGKVQRIGKDGPEAYCIDNATIKKIAALSI